MSNFLQTLLLKLAVIMSNSKILNSCINERTYYMRRMRLAIGNTFDLFKQLIELLRMVVTEFLRYFSLLCFFVSFYFNSNMFVPVYLLPRFEHLLGTISRHVSNLANQVNITTL